MTGTLSSALVRETVAKAIWRKRPDVMGKPWPFDAMDAKQRRAYPHNPIAAVDLCFIYADAAIEALRPMVRTPDFDSGNVGSTPAAPANSFSFDEVDDCARAICAVDADDPTGAVYALADQNTRNHYYHLAVAALTASSKYLDRKYGGAA